MKALKRFIVMFIVTQSTLTIFQDFIERTAVQEPPFNDKVVN